ncbi:MAG: hypothetical protein PHQ23_14845, partial [Candidatus Wallbacteria bacterium]|nr:hypothetical protein [Candidatus Wallbacteria bacterium]
KDELSGLRQELAEQDRLLRMLTTGVCRASDTACEITCSHRKKSVFRRISRFFTSLASGFKNLKKREIHQAI